jgi:hypothetical protein
MNGLESKSYTLKKKNKKQNSTRMKKKKRINPVYAVKLAI